MKKWNCDRGGRNRFFTLGIAVTLLAGVLFGIFSAGASAEIRHYDLTPAAMTGDETELLSYNPDRGLRMEVYLDVATGNSVFEHADEDAIAQLHDEIALYGSDHPQLVQVYFYLTGYKDKDLDEAAFTRMNNYFDELEKYNLKAVLRFAYISDDANPLTQEPDTDQVLAHLAQLKDWIAAHESQIHVFQLGLIGAWGECDGNALDRIGEANEKRIFDAVLANIPEDMYLQVRYHYLKYDNITPDDPNYDRVGFHDDFLIGTPHGWNTAGGDPSSALWKKVHDESANALVDGEMIWGSANKTYTGGKSINAILMAQRLADHHFTSLSLTHNYKEGKENHAGDIYSMSDWQKEYVNPKILDANDLPYNENWFLDREGNNLPRTMYDYIRDYLGYYLACEGAETTVNGTEVSVGLKLKNYGFAAPLGLKDIRLVLLDVQGNEVDSKEACPLNELQPGVAQTVELTLTKPDSERMYRLALRGEADDGTPVRLANHMEVWNGYHVLGDL